MSESEDIAEKLDNIDATISRLNVKISDLIDLLRERL